LVENRVFHTSFLAFDAPLSVSLWKYRDAVWYSKTRMASLPYGEKSL